MQASFLTISSTAAAGASETGDASDGRNECGQCEGDKRNRTATSPPATSASEAEERRTARKTMARRGTEFFPDLGAHCDEAECNQLEFLPFECDGCGGFFCSAHRTYRDHGCAKAADQGRTVVLCPECGDSVERAAPGQAERDILDAHARSGRCDPARKRKPQCPAPRCKEALTFCNTTQCKGCGIKVCLKHRFPADHSCAEAGAAAARRAAGGQCGHGARKKEGGVRRPLAVSIRSFKIC